MGLASVHSVEQIQFVGLEYKVECRFQVLLEPFGLRDARKAIKYQKESTLC